MSDESIKWGGQFRAPGALNSFGRWVMPFKAMTEDLLRADSDDVIRWLQSKGVPIEWADD